MHNRRETIKKLRKSLEDGSILGVAMKESGIKSTDTLFTWRKNTHLNRLSRLIEAARNRGEDTRNDIVEDAFFNRLKSGKATGGEYEYYLEQRHSLRWKKATPLAPVGGVPMLTHAPVINYISVPVTVVKVGNGNGHPEQEAVTHDNGNGNGRVPHE